MAYAFAASLISRPRHSRAQIETYELTVPAQSACRELSEALACPEMTTLLDSHELSHGLAVDPAIFLTAECGNGAVNGRPMQDGTLQSLRDFIAALQTAESQGAVEVFVALV